MFLSRKTTKTTRVTLSSRFKPCSTLLHLSEFISFLRSSSALLFRLILIAFFSSLLSQWKISTLQSLSYPHCLMMTNNSSSLIVFDFLAVAPNPQSHLWYSSAVCHISDFFSIFHSCVVAVVCCAASFRPSSCVLLLNIYIATPDNPNMSAKQRVSRGQTKNILFSYVRDDSWENAKRRRQQSEDQSTWQKSKHNNILDRAAE